MRKARIKVRGEANVEIILRCWALLVPMATLAALLAPRPLFDFFQKQFLAEELSSTFASTF